jgi:adenine-specific DNA-methyltransferase
MSSTLRTGEEFDERSVAEEQEFVGESSKYHVYVMYKPDIEYLKRSALTLDWCRGLV